MKNKIIIYIYYFLLLLLLVSRQNATVEPPFILRTLFVAAVIIPTIFVKYLSYPAIIILFYTLTIYGFSYSYMPFTVYLYVIITLVMVVVKGKAKRYRIPPFIWVFTLYIISIDLVYSLGGDMSSAFNNLSYCFMILVAFLWLEDEAGEKTVNQLSLCFVIISLVLSLLFLLNMQEFSSDYGYDTGLERSGWTDPNYFGMVIGMGLIAGMINMLDEKWKASSIITKLLYIATVVISFIALLLIASRGAILSMVISVMLLLLFSRVRIGYKLIIVLIASVFIYYLYVNQYFELLEYRIENDTGGGSSRIDIWNSKLKAYSEGNIFSLVFGNSRSGGWNITGEYLGFHNDYVGFLVEYGIVGLVFFLYMLYYPIKMVFKSNGNKIVVVSIMLYLIVCCFTLEPFGIGSVTFFVFYMYALLMVRKDSCAIN